MNYQAGMKLGHVGTKTRSLGQILEKPCEHIINPTLFIQSYLKKHKIYSSTTCQNQNCVMLGQNLLY